MSTQRTIRVGGACGYWGESNMATPQFLAAGGLDYIVYDYLAEITMSIMARALAKDSNAGYARDFVTVVMQDNLEEIARQGIKIITNAGGVNPRACGNALRKLIADQNLDLKVAIVLGDDLNEMGEVLSRRGVKEMYSGEDFPNPATLASVNAYLGAFPIAQALDEGADIVVTGRVVDSAVTLGACIHEFCWGEAAWDLLACGTLAGHILECGPQATGGNFTDWQDVVDRIDQIGYPIAEISSDGNFSVTKSEGTGGIVNVGTVSEQMLYEIGDPQAYVVPDVVCDFSKVRIRQEAPNRVSVTGACGYPATDSYKVSATYSDGFRGGSYRTFYGMDSDKKALGFARAAFNRARRVLREANLADFTETSIEILGAESQYGEASHVTGSREVVLKIAAKHGDQAGIRMLLKEVAGLGLANPPGGAGFAGSRPKPSPVVRLFSFLIPKKEISIHLDSGGESIPFIPKQSSVFNPQAIRRPLPPSDSKGDSAMREVPLVKLAWGRSGDKGDKANVGIIARKPEYLPFIWQSLTEKVVAKRFAHFLQGNVERFLLPGSHAINFLFHDVLGGGGVASLRDDAQGKGYAQLLLDHPIQVPVHIAEVL